MNNGISLDKILAKLDSHLHKNDYEAAERHLLYWLDEVRGVKSYHTEIPLLNELMGLYRKLGKKENAIECARCALERIEALGITHQVGAATTYLNSATVYKAFDMPSDSLPLFEKAKEIYEKELPSDDARLGGLYNNMALTLVDLGRYDDAKESYNKAIEVMEKVENGSLEVAITYLNIANVIEAEFGLEDSETAIKEYLDRAEKLLDSYPIKDGHYAFVCEKCSSVYGYYGYFLYENELKERSKKIYEGN